ncbi:MAG: hypothetical protein ACM3PY_10960 [Omnitrophica WOR_2 bacterium]
MALSNLNYSLSKGFIHNWLVAGPQVIPVEKLSEFPQEHLELAILKKHHAAGSGVTQTPVDLGRLQEVKEGENALSWHYYRCEDDHFVDLTAFYPTCNVLRAWAYAQIVLPEGIDLNLVLTTNGPADVWWNGEHVHRQEHYSKQIPLSAGFAAAAKAGANEILVRFEIAAIRETPFVMALQAKSDQDAAIPVVIPTDIESDQLENRQMYEETLEGVYLDRYVFGWMSGDRYDENEPIVVHSTGDLAVDPPLPVTYRLQSLKQDIFREGTHVTRADMVYEMAKYHPLRNGPHHLAMLPTADMYYLKKIQLDRRDLFHVVRTSYSTGLYGILKNRRREALEEASKRRADSIYSEIAKMAAGMWDVLDRKIVGQTIARINRREDGCIADLLGLIGVLFRFKRSPDLTPDIQQAIEDCILNFRYWQDEPGEDIMDFTGASRQILFHTCEILAGQLYPKTIFTNSGQAGLWHREKGERLASAWLNTRAAFGWGDWDSNTGFEEEIAALSSLVDLASSTTINEQASILMDKLFFTLGINSFQGSFGSTHGRSDTASLLSSRLEATSGISRLMWGMGNFNESLIGAANLALMKRYDFPNLLKAIALRTPDAFWDKERQGDPEKPGSPACAREVNKVTFKTRDYMLCSAQSYRPGERGSSEHIWQATLGPDAVVFTNHPACFSLDDAHQPNFWRGNAVLPRAAQWGDVLIAQYHLPEQDWLGFTHAYFPVTAFDHYKVGDHWAFAQKGKGYLALYSSCGFELVTRGPSAFRELRSYGKENTWVCQMGQELLDGSFEAFQQKIAALDFTIDRLSIHLRTLRNDDIRFGENEPFLVNGDEQPLSGFKHYENPYCTADYPAAQMDIILDEQVMRLNLSE